MSDIPNSKDQHENDSSNPYIGPRAFRREISDQSLFFGRDYETNEIVTLIMSHRLVLIYAQSGAGKTSIFNAQIIPTLENEGFEVLPTTRVQVTHSIEVENVYLYSALLYIRNSIEDNDLRKQIDTKLSSNLSLFEFLDYCFPTHKNKKMEPIPQALIFDQMEELFNIYPHRWAEQRKEFFEHISDSLANNPLLRIVFIIREDYLAQLDPFRSILPEKLRPSFRLERLRREETILAITGPVNNIIRNLDEEESENIKLEINELVNNLLKTYVELPNGELRQEDGEFVEPIHLQVVCRRWWNERTESSKLGNKKIKLEAIQMLMTH